MTNTDTGQIEVKASVTPELWTQAGRVALVFLFGLLANQLIHSEAALGMVLTMVGGVAAVGGGIATGAYGLWRHLVSHREKVAMAKALPDSVAVVK